MGAWYTGGLWIRTLKTSSRLSNFIKDRMLTKDDVREVIRQEVPGMIRSGPQANPPWIEGNHATARCT